jgi:hypothetical protein
MLHAIVRAADLTRLTATPVAVEESALPEYAAEIFRCYPNAERVEAHGEDGYTRLIYRNGLTIHRIPTTPLLPAPANPLPAGGTAAREAA